MKSYDEKDDVNNDDTDRVEDDPAQVEEVARHQTTGRRSGCTFTRTGNTFIVYAAFTCMGVCMCVCARPSTHGTLTGTYLLGAYCVVGFRMAHPYTGCTAESAAKSRAPTLYRELRKYRRVPECARVLPAAVGRVDPSETANNADGGKESIVSSRDTHVARG